MTVPSKWLQSASGIMVAAGRAATCREPRHRLVSLGLERVLRLPSRRLIPPCGRLAVTNISIDAILAFWRMRSGPDVLARTSLLRPFVGRAGPELPHIAGRCVVAAVLPLLKSTIQAALLNSWLARSSTNEHASANLARHSFCSRRQATESVVPPRPRTRVKLGLVCDKVGWSVSRCDRAGLAPRGSVCHRVLPFAVGRESRAQRLPVASRVAAVDDA